MLYFLRWYTNSDYINGLAYSLSEVNPTVPLIHVLASENIFALPCIIVGRRGRLWKNTMLKLHGIRDTYPFEDDGGDGGTGTLKDGVQDPTKQRNPLGQEHGQGNGRIDVAACRAKVIQPWQGIVAEQEHDLSGP
jgi:hypothetical protein